MVKKTSTRRKPTKRVKKVKPKITKPRQRRNKGQSAAGGHDQASRRKYDRGGRVEAYTFGEALGKDWP